MTKIKKTNKTLTCKDLLKAPFLYKTLSNKFSYRLTIIYTIVLMIILAIISIAKNNLENYSIIPNSTVFLYSTLGVAALFIIPFTTFFIFISSYEKKTPNYPKGLLIAATIFLPFIILGNLIDYIAQYIANPSLGMLSIFIILILMTYSFLAFILNLKNAYDTTYPRILSSLILAFLTFTFVLMSGYIMQLISIMR